MLTLYIVNVYLDLVIGVADHSETAVPVESNPFFILWGAETVKCVYLEVTNNFL